MARSGYILIVPVGGNRTVSQSDRKPPYGLFIMGDISNEEY